MYSQQSPEQAVRAYAKKQDGYIQQKQAKVMHRAITCN